MRLGPGTPRRSSWRFSTLSSTGAAGTRRPGPTSTTARTSSGSRREFIGALKRALNWAADEELIERNPLARMKKPAREAREMAVTPEEYARVIETVEEPHFRDLIEMASETGSRAQELRKLEARFVDLAGGRIVL